MMMMENTPDKKVSLKPFTLTPSDEVKESPGKNGVAFDVIIRPQLKSEKILCTRVSDASNLSPKIIEEKLKSAEKRRNSIQEKQREALALKTQKINAHKEKQQTILQKQQLEIRERLDKKMSKAEQELMKKKKELECRGLLRDERIRQANERKAEVKANGGE